MNLEEYSRNALAAYHARAAANGNDMLAGFHWNGRRFVIEVMQHIVAEVRTIGEVKKFSAMHNREFAGGAS